MSNQAEVVVVGGGLIGSSIAYHLAKQGRRVVVLERERIGSGASSAAAGMLGAQSEMHEAGPLFDLARMSRAMFPQLADELRELTGIDIGLVQKGLLKIALTPEQADECCRMIAFQRQAGETADWLSPEQAKELEPSLTGDIEGAMRIPGDGQVSAPELNAAYSQAAIILGGEVKEGVHVHSLNMDRGRVTGVVTDQGTLYCDQVVVAAAIGANSLLTQAGIHIDVYPVKGECFSVLTPKPLLNRSIFSEGCYLVPKRGGRLVIGATMTDRAYDRTVSVGSLMGLMTKAAQLLPAVAEAQWETSWAGLRPQTPDGLPYLGEVAGCEGLFIAAGHYRNGVLLSPATGQLISKLMIDGGPPPFARWDEFSPVRHGGPINSERRNLHAGTHR